MESKVRRSNLIGKIVVSEERGKKFGDVADLSYVAETGELMSLLISNPNTHLRELNLEEDRQGRLRVPFSAVKSVGDFVIVSEEEIV